MRAELMRRQHVIREFQIDVYTRELERYAAGGIENTERFFWASSELVLHFLTKAKKNPPIGTHAFALYSTCAIIQQFIPDMEAQSRMGKLRLVYECNPMAFIIEQAGGVASNGYSRIMELDVTELHQRSPIFIGSENMVEKATEFREVFSPQITKRTFEGTIQLQ